MLEPPLALSGSTLSVKGAVMELLKFQAVLLGEAVSDAKVMAIVAKRFGDYEFVDGVARCFLVRRERL